MKILKNRVGIVYQDNTIEKVLTDGVYYNFFGKKLVVYDKINKFYPIVDDYEVEQCKQLMSLLEVIDIKDNEIYLYFRNERFDSVLKPGKHYFWKGIYKNEFIKIDLNNPYIDDGIDRNILLNSNVREFITAYAIENFQLGLLLIDNQFVRVLEPGNYFFWKGTKSISIQKADMRKQQLDISGQEIITKDKITLRINFYAIYSIIDPKKALLDVNNYSAILYTVLQLAIREFIGSQTLDVLLEKKTEIADFILEKSKEKAIELGIELSYAGIKDIILPGDVKEILNQVLIAEKKSQANVIMRREETASTRSLLNTAKLMEENEILFRLKELEFIEKISEKFSNINFNGETNIIDDLRKLFIKKSK